MILYKTRFKRNMFKLKKYRLGNCCRFVFKFTLIRVQRHRRATKGLGMKIYLKMCFRLFVFIVQREYYIFPCTYLIIGIYKEITSYL